jgi:hypothetical protein
MKIKTKEQYETVAHALSEAGYTVDTVYQALKDAGFSVQIKDDVYEGIYASRVLAIMHNPQQSSTAEPLKLKLK